VISPSLTFSRRAKLPHIPVWQCNPQCPLQPTAEFSTLNITPTTPSITRFHPEEIQPDDVMKTKNRNPDRQAVVLDTEINWQPTADPAAWNDEPVQDGSLTLEEIRNRERWANVDNVRDLISFWRDGIEAAKRNEVLSMQDFLENLSRNPWGDSDNEWRYAYSSKSWGSQRRESRDSWHIGTDSPWGKAEVPTSMHTKETASGSQDIHTGWKQRTVQETKKKIKPTKSDAHALVENIASQQAVDPERKRRMHEFFEIPTSSQLEKIRELIQHLQKAGHHHRSPS